MVSHYVQLLFLDSERHEECTGFTLIVTCVCGVSIEAGYFSEIKFRLVGIILGGNFTNFSSFSE